jgi:membrane-associated phospholipid phosphatase
VVVLVLVFLGWPPVHAQDQAVRDALRWPAHRDTADAVSTWMVAGAVATPCLIDRTWQCVEHEGVRVGLAVVLAELTKRLAHRIRPDASDDKSFYSMHTSIACAATLRTRAWAFCPSVGYLRIAADKHWSSDVATGAAVGGLLTVVW